MEGEPQLEPVINFDAVTRLLDLATLATQLESVHVASEAEDLAERVAEGRFFVACVGQFKRGKSTLIDALIGESILPTGFVPVTSVPTVVRYGTTRNARVRAANGAWRQIGLDELQQFVSEEHNPENEKQITGAEVFCPSPLLASGMCLVDTPGLGSVSAGNTAATLAVVPHIDAVLVVTGSDPPLAGEELSLVESIAKHVKHLIIVLNKADKATDAEKAASVTFTQKLLAKRLKRPPSPVFEISARERLENRGPERDWAKLVDSLQQLVQGSGQELVQSAGDRAIQRLSEQLLAIVVEERDALLRPVEESERRIATMKQTIAEAEQSMRELGYLLMGEQQRLSDFFLERRKAYLASTLPAATQELEVALQSAPQASGPSHRRYMIQKAQEIAERHIIPWLLTEEDEGERQFRLLANRFVQMGNDFLTKLAQAQIPELSRMLRALDTEIDFSVRTEFHFQDSIGTTQQDSPLRSLGLFGTRKGIDRGAREILESLLEINSSQVQDFILKRVEESRSRLEANVRKLLQQVNRIAVLALARARKTQQEGTQAIETTLLRLNAAEKEIKEIRGSEPPQVLLPPDRKEETLLGTLST